MSSIVVVIPALNAAATLPRQLEALNRQTDLDFRVIVSDNGSSDATADVARGWTPTFHSIEVVDSSGRRGVATARNVAVNACDEDLILICDADDRVHPTWVQGMREKLAESVAVTGPLYLIWPQAPTKREVWNETAVPTSMGHSPYMPGCNMGMRRQAFNAVGGFDPDMSSGQEDVDFGWRLTELGFRIDHCAGCGVDYFQRSGTGAYLRQQWRYGKAHVDLYLKHKDAGITAASWKTSARWFVEWVKQLPRRVRRGEVREAVGGAVFQLSRCWESLRTRTSTPL